MDSSEIVKTPAKAVVPAFEDPLSILASEAAPASTTNAPTARQKIIDASSLPPPPSRFKEGEQNSSFAGSSSKRPSTGIIGGISSLASDAFSEGLSSAMAMAGISTKGGGDDNSSPRIKDNNFVSSVSAAVSNVMDNITNNNSSYESIKASSSSDLKELAGCAEAPEHPLITGEHKLMSLHDAYLQLVPGRLLPGVLFMTNYRMVFVPSATHLATIAAYNPSVYSWLNVPLACIDRVEKERKPRESRSTGITILITCKDCRVHRLTVQSTGNNSTSDYEIEKAFSVMCAYAFPNHNMKFLFAFSHSLPSEPLHLTQVDQYDPIQEFSRLGVTDEGPAGEQSPWRLSAANSDYKLCDTYPQVLVMPRRMTDDEVFAVANFRSGRRLPVMCWGDRETGATMWRSAQPKAGVSGSCAQDEKFLEIISQSCAYKKNANGVKKIVADPILHIVDCRPRASAVANRAAGAGYESQTNYPNTRLDFYNIGNIHVMRDSQKSLHSVLLSSTPKESDVNFSKQIEDTQWLSHVRCIIKASYDTASFLKRGMPVLVHCSHGWDRTAQVCAFAQLLLDPYYRTFDGFQTLIEKEWCSFGHPFLWRCGHGQDRQTRQDDQVSPIFLQFLDSVWQLLRQHPQYFEFNSRYLLTIADHIYSCRFGTFLFNCDVDRDNMSSRSRCLSIWTFLSYNKHALLNPLYMDPNIEGTPTTHVLLPPLTQLLRNVTLWTDYYLRWCTLPSMPSVPEPLAKHLSDSGVCMSSVSPLSGHEPVVHVDLQLPAMVTSDDFWEAAYRRERASKEALALQLQCSSTSSSMKWPSAASMSAVEKDEMIYKQQRVIDKLMKKLQDNDIHIDEREFINDDAAERVA